ncbi:MAG: CCA tRNA nucleotidyltransferase [Fidelibacterota bacterium]
MGNIKPLLKTDGDRYEILKNAGILGEEKKVQVYVVGGYVRDLFMGRPLTDIDLMVVGDGISFARGLARKMGLKKVVPFEAFGTAQIPLDGRHVEVASARSETYDPDSRKPAVVMATLDEDLARRDFTINSMAVSLTGENEGELFDPHGGMKDLEARVIRTPLDPDTTFSDDPLRMMRGVRFAAQLAFRILPEVMGSMKRQASRIGIVSAERITAEVYRILMTPRPSVGFNLLKKTGLLDIVFPEIGAMAGLEQPTEWHHKDIFAHTLQVVDNIAQFTDSPDLRLAALVHDIGKPVTRRLDREKGWTFHGHDAVGSRMLEKVARRMKLSNKTKEYLQKLTFLHLRPIALAMEGVTDSAIRRLMVAAVDDVDDLMMLCRADITSRNPGIVRRYMGNFDRVEKMMQDVKQRDKLRAFQSPVRGDQIMKECGIPPGPLVGEIKKRIEDAILDGDIENTYEAAYEFFQELKGEYAG